jgi:hypothetical protein
VALSVLRVLHKQPFDLLFSYTADFEAFYAASLTAEDSNSALGSFQKLRQEFDKRFIGAAFYCGSLQSNFYSAGDFASDFIFAGARLYTHGKNDRAGGKIFRDLKHGN